MNVDVQILAQTVRDSATRIGMLSLADLRHRIDGAIVLNRTYETVAKVWQHSGFVAAQWESWFRGNRDDQPESGAGQLTHRRADKVVREKGRLAAGFERSHFDRFTRSLLRGCSTTSVFTPLATVPNVLDAIRCRGSIDFAREKSKPNTLVE